MEINKPKSGGKSTEFGAGDFISAAMGPRRAVGVHGCCFTGILISERSNQIVVDRSLTVGLFPSEFCRYV